MSFSFFSLFSKIKLLQKTLNRLFPTVLTVNQPTESIQTKKITGNRKKRLHSVEVSRKSEITILWRLFMTVEYEGEFLPYVTYEGEFIPYIRM